MSISKIAFFSSFWFVLIINQLSSCRQNYKQFEPLALYTFSANKFQVKDVIDSIVKNENTIEFKKLTNFIDTFILERSFCIRLVNDPDSIRYYYYYSGDIKEWLTNTDSTFLILSDIYYKNEMYNWKNIKKIPNSVRRDLLSFFDEQVYRKALNSISKDNPYVILIIDSIQYAQPNGTGVVCRQNTQCDTLKLKYIDAGKFTATKNK